MKRVAARAEPATPSDQVLDLSDDVLWGLRAIAKHVRRTIRQTSYLVDTKRLPVKKLGKRIVVARKSELDAALRSLSA